MTGKQASELSGELVAAPVNVPFAPGFNVEKLKEADPSPMFATVKIKPGKGNGGKGPNYGPALLQDLARQFNEKRPPGYRGHQQADRVGWEWRDPVTAWVGAQWDDSENVLYVKGYVPPTAGDLRTQLELASTGADIVNSVSIFGLRDVAGDEVTAFDLWSLDWTPKGRAGMETELVTISGEIEEDEMTREEIIASIHADELPTDVQDALRLEGRRQTEDELKPAATAVGEMRVILDLDESADAEAVLNAVRDIVSANRSAELETQVDQAMEKAVAGELQKAAVRERVLARVAPGVTQEELAGEIAEAIELPHIKALGGQKTPTVIVNKQSNDSGRKATSWA